MPAKYEAIKESRLKKKRQKQSRPLTKRQIHNAKKEAAKIYNSQSKKKVSPSYD